MSQEADTRSLVERRIAGSMVDEVGVGRPLSRRARHTRRTVEAYLAAGVMPRYMERLRAIDAEIARLRTSLARSYRALREECGADADAFARRWRARASSWRFEPLNQLIQEHNEWYPIEAALPLDPRTGDYVPIRGRSYRREPVGLRWVLREFPGR